MRAWDLEPRAASKKDLVQFCDIHGINAMREVFAAGKLLIRVTLFGIYCLDMFTQGSQESRSGTKSNPSMSSPLPSVFVDNDRMLSSIKRSKETVD